MGDLQSESLEDAGRVALEVAHDLNNVLLAIQAFATMLSSRIPEGTIEHEDAVEILRATERGAAIVHGLVTFGGGSARCEGPLHIGAALGDIGRMLDHLAGPEVKLIVDVAANLPAVRFDSCAFQRVVANLVRNAGEAMPKGGVVAVRAIAGEGRVALSVADTGPGIASHELPRIFEPFYSTKPHEARAGMGLASAYKLVTAHGATIRAGSTPGGGATFEIDFPVSAN